MLIIIYIFATIALS